MGGGEGVVSTPSVKFDPEYLEHLNLEGSYPVLGSTKYAKDQ